MLTVNIKLLKKLASSLTILYVEDDLAIQQTMSKYLRKFFLDVTVADDGVEALSLFNKATFDIVITDLSMPKMNGITLIDNIRELQEDQPILITTAHAESNFLLSAIKAHVDGYIIKPFDYESLNFELFKISQKIQKFKENESYKTDLQNMLKVQTQEINNNYEKTIYSIVELIEQRDTYTAGHSKRVAFYCELIAKEMNYSEEECTLIHQAGILHDVGKIETPDAVLLNPKRLNDLEYQLIQEHVDVGYKLLDTIPMFKHLAHIIYEHHERYDGLGYPNALKGDEIDKLARIMIVADAFDAMTTNRIYKARKSVDKAIEELKELSGKQFHPLVVQSAEIALKDIVIDKTINQLPVTKVEEERFAYFYKDSLSHLYNQHYLDVVLMKNSYELVFTTMLIFSLNKFSDYNKKNSWLEGDKLLKEFGAILQVHLDNEYIFRVFGDEFVVMGKQNIEIEGVCYVLDTLMEKNAMSYRLSTIDLTNQKIEKLTDIEIIS